MSLLGRPDPWQEFLDAQERALPVAVAALAAGGVPTWPELAPPDAPATPAALARVHALRTAVEAVQAAARARQVEIATELAGLAPVRARNATADDPTLGASVDLSG